MAELIKYGASPPMVILDDDDVNGIPLGGVSLYDFENFIEKCGGEAALKGKTTEDVCTEYIKVLTVETKVSYIDHLRLKSLPVSLYLYQYINIIFII